MIYPPRYLSYNYCLSLWITARWRGRTLSNIFRFWNNRRGVYSGIIFWSNSNNIFFEVTWERAYVIVISFKKNQLNWLKIKLIIHKAGWLRGIAMWGPAEVPNHPKSGHSSNFNFKNTEQKINFSWYVSNFTLITTTNSIRKINSYTVKKPTTQTKT